MQVIPDTPGMQILEEAAGACLHCTLCQHEYCNARPTSEDLGTVAKMALEHKLPGGAIDSNHIDNPTADWARRCSLCDKCTQGCPAGISAREVFWAIRQGIGADPDVPDYYRRMRTDYATNNFTLLWELTGQQFTWEALEHPQAPRGSAPADTALFMPGCTLETYAPELTEKVRTWLVDQGEASRATALCCGNPIFCTGDQEAIDRYRSAFAERLAAGGFTKVITSCPNCVRSLRDTLKATGLADKIEVEALAVTLDRAGLAITRENLEASGVDPDAAICVQDSCPDRLANEFGRAVRHLLTALPQVERQHHGRYTTCCGSGGLTTSWMGEVADERGLEVRHEVSAAGGSLLVTSCVSCANAFARVNADGSGDAAGSQDGIAVRHYLELLFGTRIDWAGLREAQARQYSDEGQAWMNYKFAQNDLMLPPLAEAEGVSHVPGAPTSAAQEG